MIGPETSGQQTFDRPLPAIGYGNFVATVAPSPSDDETLGYSINSMWFDASLNRFYKCVDASEGAANWREMLTDAAPVDYNQITGFPTNKIAGRSTAGTGFLEALSPGTGLQISAGSLSVNQSALTLTSIGGTLSIAKGGTGQTSAVAAFNALSPVTTLGDLIYGSGSNANSRLAGQTTTTKKFLTQTGNGTISAAPGWNTIAMADLGTGSPSSSNYLRGDGAWTALPNDLTIGNAVSGGGANRILFEDASSNLGASSSLIWNGASFGVGTSTFTDPITGTSKTNFVDGTMQLSFRDNATGQGWLAISNGTMTGFVGHTNTTDGFTLGAYSNHKVTLRANNTNSLVAETTGNITMPNGVGIGSSTLADAIAGTAKLRIDAGTMKFGFVDNSGQGWFSVTNGTIIAFGAHLNTTDGVVFGSYSNHKMNFRTNNVNRLLIDANGDTQFLGSKLGFFSATPASKPTVTGSRGGNAALQSALTALATLGLITDSSS